MLHFFKDSPFDVTTSPNNAADASAPIFSVTFKKRNAVYPPKFHKREGAVVKNNDGVLSVNYSNVLVKNTNGIISVQLTLVNTNATEANKAFRSELGNAETNLLMQSSDLDNLIKCYEKFLEENKLSELITTKTFKSCNWGYSGRGGNSVA